MIWEYNMWVVEHACNFFDGQLRPGALTMPMRATITGGKFLDAGPLEAAAAIAGWANGVTAVESVDPCMDEGQRRLGVVRRGLM